MTLLAFDSFYVTEVEIFLIKKSVYQFFTLTILSLPFNLPSKSNRYISGYIKNTFPWELNHEFYLILC